jgi:hypothetical protein
MSLLGLLDHDEQNIHQFNFIHIYLIRLTHTHTHTQYDVNFIKKTSQKKRTSGTKKIRRWVKFTKKQLAHRHAQNKRETFLKKNKSAANKFWARYKSGKDDPVDHGKMFADLKFADMYAIEVFILYWKFETTPADLDESHFYLGLAQLNEATTPTKLRNAIEKEKKRILSSEDAMDDFITGTFSYISLMTSSAKIGATGKRIDESDGNAYTFEDFVECYGDDAKDMWASSQNEAPRVVLQMKKLLEFSKIGEKVFFKGTPCCADLWTEFLTTRPKGYCFEGDETTSFGRDEWTQIFKYLKATKTNFEDFDEYTAPSVLSHFKEWLETGVKEGKWGTQDDEQKGGDSKEEDGGDDDLW